VHLAWRLHLTGATRHLDQPDVAEPTVVDNSIRDTLGRLGAIVRFGVPLAGYTSYGVGGPADILIEPNDPDELARALAAVRDAGLPLTLLGAGTNVCISDRGIRGAVIRLANNYAGARYDGTRVIALAGTPIGLLSRECADRGLAGLEFACSIPGSVGGAVAMNAGAMGGEVAHVFTSTEAFDPTGEPLTLRPADMDFGYRRSVLRSRRLIVSEVAFELRPGDPGAIRAEIDCLDAKRYARQPKDPACAGSVFKNPPGMRARALLEEAGAQAIQCGQARVSAMHANFVVNCGGASAADIRAVIDRTRQLVLDRFGIELELENEFLGEW
jgi:UDP-N-acetylmuramate dehydrogenase